jgi:hypothetical protein
VSTCLLVQVGYSDSGTPISQPIAAGPKNLISPEVGRLNDARTAEELRNEIEYQMIEIPTLTVEQPKVKNPKRGA